jgi:hypothetical protein
MAVCGAVTLTNVRFGPLSGLKSDISRGPRSAIKGDIIPTLGNNIP